MLHYLVLEEGIMVYHSSKFHMIVFIWEQIICFFTREKLPKNSTTLRILEKVAKNVSICSRLIKKIDLLTCTLRLFMNVPCGVILWILQLDLSVANRKK